MNTYAVREKMVDCSYKGTEDMPSAHSTAPLLGALGTGQPLPLPHSMQTEVSMLNQGLLRF